MTLNPLKTALICGLVVLAGGVPARGALISVMGPDSTSGYAPEIIVAPSDTRNNATPYSRQVGFDEKQGVVLPGEVKVDGGVILATGTRVSSHMIYLERLRGPGQPASVWHLGVDWTFDGPILGVMSSINGGREAASQSILGLDTTAYAQFSHRGMEANDTYSVSGSTLTVNMKVTEPGDWIRVVTLAPPRSRVPETGGWMAGVIGGLFIAGLRRLARRGAA